jgi:hypothetical protein
MGGALGACALSVGCVAVTCLDNQVSLWGCLLRRLAAPLRALLASQPGLCWLMPWVLASYAGGTFDTFPLIGLLRGRSPGVGFPGSSSCGCTWQRAAEGCGRSFACA